MEKIIKATMELERKLMTNPPAEHQLDLKFDYYYNSWTIGWGNKIYEDKNLETLLKNYQEILKAEIKFQEELEADFQEVA